MYMPKYNFIISFSLAKCNFLALFRKYNITLRTHIEEIDSSIISDNLILDLWFMGT